MNIPENQGELLLAYMESIELVDRLYEKNKELEEEIETLREIILQFKKEMGLLVNKEGGLGEY